jgi:hypothetical protein
MLRRFGGPETADRETGVLAGMRPGEIFGLKWPRLTPTCADIRQRVCRNVVVDTPKTNQSYRKAALSKGLLQDIEQWRLFAVDPEVGVSVREVDAPVEGQLLAPQDAAEAG